jgi:hypothetical protein
MGSGR